MKKTGKLLTRYLIPLIIVLSLPAVRYLFVSGFFGVSDDLHIGWLYEMDRAVKMWQFPPRFVPDLSYGFGYPLFNFVYPLPFYLGEVFHLLGFSLVNSVKLVFGLSIPFSIYFMYLFLKELLPERLSLAGAVLYVYAPYRAVEIFVRGGMGEIVAFVFMPVVALAFVHLSGKKPTMKWIGITALSLASLVLSHNIMAYLFLPLALLLLMARICFIAENKKKSLFYSLAGLLLGLTISLYLWGPAIFESRLMHYDTVFNFYDHFPTLKQLITPYFGYGASVPGPYDTMSFYIGWVGLAVVFLGLTLFIYRLKKFSPTEKIFLSWGLVIFFVSIFMMNYRSAFLWRSLPLLPYFQFPWRFLAMIAFISPIFLLGLSKSKLGNLGALILIFSAIILNFSYFKFSEYLGREDNYYLDRYIPYPSASEAYRKTSEEYLRLPKETLVRPDKIYPRAYAAVEANLQIKEKNALDATIGVNYPESFILNYNKYYYPGWVAKIDGNSVEIIPGKPYGQISLSVPGGRHIIDIKYRESATRRFLDLVSLGSLVLAGFLVIKRKR